MSVSPYGTHDLHVSGGMSSSRVTNPKRLAEVQRDADDLVRIQREARARFFGPESNIKSALGSEDTKGGSRL